MESKAKVFLVAIATVFILFVNTGATDPPRSGVLQTLDRELADLVKKSEPFLVTVEAANYRLDRMLVGSGLLVDKGGSVLTTTSVIGEKSDNIVVTFKDEESYPAQLVGADYQTGLAMLKIDPVDRPTPLFGDPYKLREGSLVVVIGNSYDMPNAVNFGVFSGVTDQGLLQLSVQTSPGSSGGAVFNANGELVGLLVAQATETMSLFLRPDTPPYGGVTVKDFGASGAPGMGVEFPSANAGLAIPADRLQTIAEQFRRHGEVKHGYLGIRPRRLSSGNIAEKSIESGVVVSDVAKSSPAEAAGLQKGDVVVSVDGRQVKSPGHLYSIVRSHLPGDTVELRVLRSGSYLTVKATLSEAPKDEFLGLRSLEPGFDALATMPGNLHEAFDQIQERLGKLKGAGSPELERELAGLERKLDDLEKQLKALSDKFNELERERGTESD